MTTLIFANGDLDQVDWIRPALASARAVIAANGGSRHLYRLNYLPQAVVGDLDSLPQPIRDWLQKANVPLITHPEDKDETDLELALLHALATYDDDLQVFAAFGGRLDQTLANILLLAHPQLTGRRIELVTRYERAWLVTSRSEIQGERGDTVSLIPLAGDVQVKETKGLRWALMDERLSFGLARGVSNTMITNTAEVEIYAGILLCIHTRQSWHR